MMPQPAAPRKAAGRGSAHQPIQKGEEDGRKGWLDKSAEENAGQEDQLQTASFTPVSSRR
jgi:hypothetical protein